MPASRPSPNSAKHAITSLLHQARPPPCFAKSQPPPHHRPLTRKKPGLSGKPSPNLWATRRNRLPMRLLAQRLPISKLKNHTPGRNRGHPFRHRRIPRPRAPPTRPRRLPPVARIPLGHLVESPPRLRTRPRATTPVELHRHPPRQPPAPPPRRTRPSCRELAFPPPRRLTARPIFHLSKTHPLPHPSLLGQPPHPHLQSHRQAPRPPRKIPPSRISHQHPLSSFFVRKRQPPGADYQKIPGGTPNQKGPPLCRATFRLHRSRQAPPSKKPGSTKPSSSSIRISASRTAATAPTASSPNNSAIGTKRAGMFLRNVRLL